ncbi:MAG: transcription antitermination factor NusB [Chromatiales bacterium]|nr:transcription antitermination factor NusB [Chromatiales bacterium]MDX9766498.1 transcription antitermination factor NusB [Ectothiorhodospiraceae bacterium]
MTHKPDDPRRLAHARRRSRRLAMQALYQWQLTGYDPKDILSQFKEDEDYGKCDGEYFRDLLMQITADAPALDALLEPHLERPMDRVDPVEAAILRVAAYELRSRLDVPYRVVLNEAIDLAKKFGADQSHKFVNSALDRVAQQLRRLEMG